MSHSNSGGVALSAAQRLLEFAKQAASKAETQEALHNAVFGSNAKFSQLFKTQVARAEFMKSPQYQEIAKLIADLPRQDASETSSGQFRLRLPKSMHQQLTAEAEAEGISLNQLCIAKLAMPLRLIVR